MSDVPQAANAEKYENLGSKTLWLFILDRSMVAAVILLVSLGLFFIGKTTGPLNVLNLFTLDIYIISFFGFALFVVAFAIAAFVGWLVYANYKFLLGADALKIKKGVLNKEEVAIPYRQIQDVTIERDLSYQMFGLSKLTILTAGHEEAGETGEAEGILPALDADVAEKMRDELLRRANVEKVASVQSALIF